MRVVFDKYMYKDADGDAPFRVYADVNDTGTVIDGRAVRDGDPPEAWFSVHPREYHAMLPEERASNLESHCWDQGIVSYDWGLYEVRTNGLSYLLQFCHDSDKKRRTEVLVNLDFAASRSPFPTEIVNTDYHVSEYKTLVWRMP